jgi:hypothetical protein
MNRYLLLFSLLFCYNYSFSQIDGGKKTNVETGKETAVTDLGTPEKQKEKLVRTAEDLKSGNYKDVLYSFFQIAVKDFTGESRALAFNTTLFAIKAKANSNLIKDVNFKNQTFARNLQFNFKINLDQSFKYKGVTGGFTYALINDRDKQTAILSDAVDKAYGEISEALNVLVADGDASALNDGLETFVNTGELKDFPKDFLNKNNDKLRVLAEKVEAVNKQVDAEYAAIEKKSLWTIAFNGTHDKVTSLNSGSVNSVFLNGQKHEIDIRAALSYGDTIAVTKVSQINFKSTAGFNFKLFSDPKSTWLEFKPHMEYNGVFKNRLPDQKTHNFLANAELRLRLSKDIWLPVIMKYDIKDSNFLGFLNVTFNMDGFK